MKSSEYDTVPVSDIRRDDFRPDLDWWVVTQSLSPDLLRLDLDRWVVTCSLSAVCTDESDSSYIDLAVSTGLADPDRDLDSGLGDLDLVTAGDLGEVILSRTRDLEALGLCVADALMAVGERGVTDRIDLSAGEGLLWTVVDAESTSNAELTAAAAGGGDGGLSSNNSSTVCIDRPSLRPPTSAPSPPLSLSLLAAGEAAGCCCRSRLSTACTFTANRHTHTHTQRTDCSICTTSFSIYNRPMTD